MRERSANKPGNRLRGLVGADPRRMAVPPAPAQLSRGTTKIHHATAAHKHRQPHIREGAEHDMGEIKSGRVQFKD